MTPAANRTQSPRWRSSKGRPWSWWARSPLARSGPSQKLDVKLVSVNPGNITMQMGTQVVPDAVLGDTDLYDLLYVPGGVGSGPMSLEPRVIDVIRRHHQARRVD
jgi:transcriptional regulator GlxA family with amidase domain